MLRSLVGSEMCIRDRDKTVKRPDKFSLLSIRLSGIHACNELMGLNFTNNLIKRVFHIIKNCVDSRSYISRRGGGRFCILLKGDDVYQTKNILRILHYSILKCLERKRLINLYAILKPGYPISRMMG